MVFGIALEFGIASLVAFGSFDDREIVSPVLQVLLLYPVIFPSDHNRLWSRRQSFVSACPEKLRIGLLLALVYCCACCMETLWSYSPFVRRRQISWIRNPDPHSFELSCFAPLADEAHKHYTIAMISAPFPYTNTHER